jgi:predicted Zn-dependent protease
MLVLARLGALFYRFVRMLRRPFRRALGLFIETAGVRIVGFGSAWERTRGHGQSANNTARHLAWYPWRRIESRDWRGARYFAKAAIAADPGYADGYRMLAQAYDRSGDRTTAREVCERGLRAAPDSASLWDELGAIEARAERLDAAEAPWRRALELRPDEPRVMRRLAGLLESQRRWREALPLLERIWALEPTDTSFLVRLARVRVDTGAFHEAEELLRGGIADKPSLADAHYWLAISLAGLNR